MPARISQALTSSLIGKTAKRSKYGNRKVERDGFKFDSVREADRWSALRLLQRAGEISSLERQVSIPLKVNDKLVCTYVADFAYWEKGARVIEDAKGFRTREYINKAKLFAALHGFEIREV